MFRNIEKLHLELTALTLKDSIFFKLTTMLLLFLLFSSKENPTTLHSLTENFNYFVFNFIELDLFPELIGTEEIIKV